MNFTALLIAAGVGLVLQGGMVWAAHRNQFVRENLLAVTAISLSLSAGLIDGKLGGQGWGATLLGGAVAGGLSTGLAFTVSFVLKDLPAAVLALGTLAAAVAGGLGAAMGRLLV